MADAIRESTRIDRRRTTLWRVLALVSIGVAALSLSAPHDTDARVAMSDAYQFGLHAGAPDAIQVDPHHPGHSLLTRQIAHGLRVAGDPEPGHRAVRLLAVMGWLGLLAVLRPSRGTGVLAWCLPLLASRGMGIEVLVGEVLPFGLFLIALAWRLAASPRPSRRLWLHAVIPLGLIYRQDFCLLVPFLAWMATAAGPRRGPRAAGCLLAHAAIAVSAYALIHASIDPASSFPDWLLERALAPGRSWAPETLPGTDEVLRFLAAGGAAAVGWRDVAIERAVPIHALIGALVTVPLLVRTALSSAPERWLLLFAAGVQFAFYAWFEPANFEWWLPIWTLLTIGAIGCDQPSSRGMLPGLVPAVIAVALLCAHGPSTAALLDRRVASDAQEALALIGEHPDAHLLVADARLALWIEGRGIPFEDHTRTTPDRLVVLVVERAASDDGPGLLLVTRGLGDGSPAFLSRPDLDAWGPWLDGLAPDARSRPLRDAAGRVHAFAWNLAPR